MGVGVGLHAFVEIGPPFDTGRGFYYGVIFFEQRKGDAILHCPGGQAGDFGVDGFSFGERRCDVHLGNQGLINLYGVDIEAGLVEVEDCADAVDFEIEIAFGDIAVGRYEKFDTAIFPDLAVIVCFDGFGAFFLDAEDDVEVIVIVEDFGLCLGHKFGFVAHIKGDVERLNFFPLRFVPVRVDFQRLRQSVYLICFMHQGTLLHHFAFLGTAAGKYACGNEH